MISNSIIDANVSTVYAVIIDFFDVPGVGHAYTFKRFQVASSMTIQELYQL